ncbi:hypothetical protein [Micromonospora sp. HK10]|uniref:hypothetical protein n=1 Tax=Micromonospora sp. HK10 TaxID=1538294 RepID=UPI0012E268ED|nr:hypothetical protein [Micromonospora sp. HK10]
MDDRSSAGPSGHLGSRNRRPRPVDPLPALPVRARSSGRAACDHAGMRTAQRLVAGLLALLWAVPGFGLIDLEVTVAPDEVWRPVAILDGGWGLFVTAYIVAGLVLVMIRPSWATEIAGQLTGIAALLAVSAGLAREYTVWWMLLALLLPAGAFAGLAALDRRRGAPVGGERAAPVRPSVRWAYAGLAVVGAAPWTGYALDMYRANRDQLPPNEITNDVNHWAVQGAFAMTLVGFAALAALRPSLRRFNAVRVGVCAAYFGICSLRFPESAAALSTSTAALAVAWGVAVLLVSAVDRPAGRPAQSPRPPASPVTTAS